MKTTTLLSLFTAAVAALFLSPVSAWAHCDTLDGPVVEAGKLALEKSDVTPVLKWVKADDEKEIRDAFARALKVRALGKEARELADFHFFETLVRVHRAGEGVPYTGLKPAGSVDPGIAAADKALQLGSAEDLAREMAKAVEKGILKRFAEVAEKKKHAEHNVEAGRAYVAAYAGYVHFIEAIASMASAAPEAHQLLHTAEHAH
jgi:hypothetical protein